MASQKYHVIAASGTNEDTIKSSPGEVTGWFLTNKSQVFRFVKLFNATSPPTLSSATPKLTLGIPALSSANVALQSPLTFSTGITIAIVGGIPIGGTGGVNDEDCSVDILYE